MISDGTSRSYVEHQDIGGSFGILMAHQKHCWLIHNSMAQQELMAQQEHLVAQLKSMNQHDHTNGSTRLHMTHPMQ